MCYRLPVDEKLEPAAGFPRGWRFYFAESPIVSGTYTYEPVPGLNILSPGDKKFRSVEAATAFCAVGEVNEVARIFYTHVGLPSRLPKNGSSLMPAPHTSSLSKYRVLGSRVYCMMGKQGRWGVVTEKLEVTPNEYTFTVSCRSRKGTHTVEDDSFFTRAYPLIGSHGRRQLVEGKS